jgi:hypothetical protein
MKHIRKIFALAVFLTLAVHLCGCNPTQGLKPSQTTANQFLQQMQARQFSQAHQLLSTKAKAVTTQQQLQDLWDFMEKSKGPIKSWTLAGAHFYTGTGGSNVQLGYKLQCERGSGGVKFLVVPENENWLIQSFNLS